MPGGWNRKSRKATRGRVTTQKVEWPTDRACFPRENDEIWRLAHSDYKNAQGHARSPSEKQSHTARKRDAQSLPGLWSGGLVDKTRGRSQGGRSSLQRLGRASSFWEAVPTGLGPGGRGPGLTCPPVWKEREVSTCTRLPGSGSQSLRRGRLGGEKARGELAGGVPPRSGLLLAVLPSPWLCDGDSSHRNLGTLFPSKGETRGRAGGAGVGGRALGPPVQVPTAGP